MKIFLAAVGDAHGKVGVGHAYEKRAHKEEAYCRRADENSCEYADVFAYFATEHEIRKKIGGIVVFRERYDAFHDVFVKKFGYLSACEQVLRNVEHERISPAEQRHYNRHNRKQKSIV